MPRVELKRDIRSSLKQVYDIAVDTENSARWCLPVKEVKKVSEGRFDVKSTVGDFTYVHTEEIENVKISAKIEGGIFSAMGYVLSIKYDLVEVMLWGEFENKKHKKALTKAGSLLLDSLKNFVEYLEDGGDPDLFDKKQITVAP